MFLYPVNNSIQMSLLTSKIVVHNLLENLKKSKFSSLSPLIWLCNKLKYFLFFTGCCACVYKRLIIWLHTHTHTHRIVHIKMSKSKHFLFHTCVGTISVCIQDIFATKDVKRAATHEEYTRNKIKNLPTPDGSRTLAFAQLKQSIRRVFPDCMYGVLILVAAYTALVCSVFCLRFWLWTRKKKKSYRISVLYCHYYMYTNSRRWQRFVLFLKIKSTGRLSSVQLSSTEKKIAEEYSKYSIVGAYTLSGGCLGIKQVCVISGIDFKI